MYLRVDNVRKFIADLNRRDTAHVRGDEPALSTADIVRQDDVVLARTGTLGKAMLAKGPLVGTAISQHVTRLTVKDQYSSRWSPAFLCAYLNSRFGSTQLAAGGFGSTRPELTHERLASVEVPVVAEQLSRVIDARACRGIELMYAAFSRVQGAVDLFSRTILDIVGDQQRKGSFWTPLKDPSCLWTPRYYEPGIVRKLEGFRRAFRVRRLSDVAHIERGEGTRTSSYAVTGMPFIRTTSLINFGIDPFPDHYASLDTYHAFDQPVQPGDILLSIEGKIGELAYLGTGDECVFKNHIELVRVVDDEVNPFWVLLLLGSELGQQMLARLTVVQATLAGLASRSREVEVPVQCSSSLDSACAERFSRARQMAVEACEEAVALRSAGVALLRESLALLEHSLAMG
jgi:type I restriction enzyme S subunit